MPMSPLPQPNGQAYGASNKKRKEPQSESTRLEDPQTRTKGHPTTVHSNFPAGIEISQLTGTDGLETNAPVLDHWTATSLNGAGSHQQLPQMQQIQDPNISILNEADSLQHFSGQMQQIRDLNMSILNVADNLQNLFHQASRFEPGAPRFSNPILDFSETRADPNIATLSNADGGQWGHCIGS